MSMTRDDVMRLSGRELDAAVAEHVMGWKRGDPKYGDMPWYPPGIGRYLGGGRLNLPKFSTDIAAAWEVVERLAEFEINDIEVTVEIRNVAEGWACWIHSGCEEIAEAREETAPLAICRAALLAMVGARRRARDRIL